jgi:proteic killer suppression protein
MPIQSFGDKATEAFYLSGEIPRNAGWRSLAKIAIRKLDMIAFAKTLDDLKAPPNNRLEKLRDDLLGFYSVRINDQWRVVFQWTAQGPTKVKIIDYH